MNLNESHESGSHWVAMFFGSDLILYFDSFGLHPPEEVVTLSNTFDVNYAYNNVQYQAMLSVLCGYYCLWFLNEVSRKVKRRDLAHKSLYTVFNDVVKPLSHSDTSSNERFIVNYFT